MYHKDCPDVALTAFTTCRPLHASTLDGFQVCAAGCRIFDSHGLRPVDVQQVCVQSDLLLAVAF